MGLMTLSQAKKSTRGVHLWMLIVKALGGFVLVAIASIALADPLPDMKAFGIQIGAPLTLPRCGVTSMNTTHVDQNAGGPCTNIIMPKGDDESGGPYTTAWFPSRLAPRLGGRSFPTMHLAILDNNVESVKLLTNPDKQAEVFKDLELKYGKAHRIARESMQNSTGAKFDSINAEWIWPDRLYVSFKGMDDYSGTGVVRISSPRYLQRVQQNSRKPDMKVYGAQVGAPITLPRCVTTTDVENASGLCALQKDPKYEYYESKDAKSGGEIIAAWFPSRLVPRLGGTKVALILLVVLDNKVESVKINTNGIHDQEDVLKDLEHKYGKAHKTAYESMQNIVGAKFDSINAEWTWPGRLYVSFKGTDGDLDHGSVAISSPRYLQRVQQNSRNKPQF